jgi:hypothetical protein
VERNRKAGQNPPRVVAPIEEEEGEEDDDDDQHLLSCQSHVIFDVLIFNLLVTYIFRIL